MQKVILTSVFVMAITFVIGHQSVFGQLPEVNLDPNAVSAPAPRLRIEVSGYPDNRQAYKLISDYYRQKLGKDYELVETNPDYIIQIKYFGGGVQQSWQALNKKAVTKNGILSVVQDLTQNLGYRVNTRNPVLSVLKDGAIRTTTNQLESRKRPEVSNMEKWKGSVEKRFIDAKTRETIKSAYAENVIVVERYQARYGEPQVYLAEGDLGTVVDLSTSPNLGTNVNQLLALSTFMKAELPISVIINLVDDQK